MRIRVPVKGARGGIGQRQIAVQAGREYEVRVQLKADGPLTVLAGLCDGSGQEPYGGQSRRLEKGDWQTWRFAWRAPQTDPQARLEIVFQGPGALWVGAASLLPGDNFHGMRRDVVARLKELGLSLVRWPGGSFTRDYRWKGGLAALDQRPPIHCPYLPFSDQFDFHEIGTDEFMALCRELGSQPCITVTMGIPEGAQEAADWVRVPATDRPTPPGASSAPGAGTGAVRCRALVHRQRDLGRVDGAGLQHRRRVCPQPQAIRHRHAKGRSAPGIDRLGHRRRDAGQPVGPQDRGPGRRLLRLALAAPLFADHQGPHRAGGCAGVPRQARQPREGLLPWLREMRRAIDQSRPGRKPIPIAFDEWNLWHNWFTRHYEAQWHVGPIDAAFAAAELHMFCQEFQSLDLASTAMFQPVNEGLIRVTPFSADLTAMGQAFALLRTHGGGRLLKTAPPGDAQAVDSCASLSADGRRVIVTLLNRSADRPQPLALSLRQGRAAKALATVLSVKELQVRRRHGPAC